jgi:BMFP domain-containing protein YqiC
MQTKGSYFSEEKMKNRSTIFSDLSKMAQGAASLADEMRLEVKNIINARNQRKQNESNLVTYEDFEALTTRLQSLISRIELLEIKVENTKTVKKQKSTVSKKISKRKN